MLDHRNKFPLMNAEEEQEGDPQRAGDHSGVAALGNDQTHGVLTISTTAECCGDHRYGGIWRLNGNLAT